MNKSWISWLALCLIACAAKAETLKLDVEPEVKYSCYIPTPEPMYAPQFEGETDHNFQVRYSHWKVKHDAWLAQEKINHEAFLKTHPRCK